jgi:hypothetical protein
MHERFFHGHRNRVKETSQKVRELGIETRVNKRRKVQARTLADISGRCVADVFSRQGFSSVELVTHWEDIVGRDISAQTEPLKIQWPHYADPDDREPGILVLRVEGPGAIEIQHLSNVILDRVNGFLGWRAVGRLALRQAPLRRRPKRRRPTAPDPQLVQRMAGELTDINDTDLRMALCRLGAAIKRT